MKKKKKSARVTPQSTRAKAIPYVLKENVSIQVVLKGKPFSLDSSHPTFLRLQRALKRKNWAVIPKLVTIANAVHADSHGDVRVEKGKVYYKGKEMHNSLCKRIVEMVMQRKPIKHLILFMDNLHQCPSSRAISEFYDWLVDNDLPITDDGEFLAYKSVKSNNTDTYSGKVDNSPGQIIMMNRAVANSDYDQQCSTGFHICSKQYGVYGDKTMAVKVNPKYVLSAVAGKMRVTHYEVLMELGRKDSDLFKLEGFTQLEKKLVVEIGKERKELIKMLLSVPDIKRSIRKKKLAKASLLKYSYVKLKAMVQKRGLIRDVGPNVGPTDRFFLEKARKAAGLTIGQLAYELGSNYKAVATLEKKEKPSSAEENSYLKAIAKLTGTNRYDNSVVSYPKPVAVAV